MKVSAVSLALLIFAATSSAYAADPTPAVSNTSSAAQSEQSIPPASANLSKTREQIYQELRQAQQSGQLAELNKTVYRAN